MSVYKRFIKLLELWPIDKSKTGRDLGEHLRKQAKTIFATENSTSLEDDQLDKQIQALERLSKNTYGIKYPRLRTSTSTGLSAEQCNQVLSSEFLDYLNDDKGKGLFTK